MGSIDAIMEATKETLLSVDEVGEKIADSIIQYFQNEEHRTWMTQLKESGLQISSNHVENLQSDLLATKVFVVSGVFEKYGRDEIKSLIESHGGKVSGSISAKPILSLPEETWGLPNWKRPSHWEYPSSVKWIWIK